MDGLRIGVDPASLRIVESFAVPPDTAVFVTDDDRVRDSFEIEPVTITAKLDTGKFAEMFRLMAGSADKAAQALRSLRIGFRRPPALRRPRSPGPADAATRRLHTARRHVYRRALRRRRRQPASRFTNYERFREIYAPNAVVLPPGPYHTLEAQLMAYQPKG